MERDSLVRYSRQLNLPDFGAVGQEKLKQTKVLVIGAGGLGSPLLLYLTAAGVGTIGVIDHDQVELSNLHRQILFEESDIGQNKAETAIIRLKKLNGQVSFRAYPERLTRTNAMQIVSQYDIIADGSDNFPTRYLVNDACVLAGKPLVYGSVFRYEGQVSVFNLKDENGTTGPNYRDLFPTPPPPAMVLNCADGGVLGVLPGIIGALQANEVIKIATRTGTPLSGKLLLFDSLGVGMRQVKIDKLKGNPLTGTDPTIHELQDYEAFCGIGQEQTRKHEISIADFKRLRESNDEFQLVDVRHSMEFEAGNIGGICIPLDELPGKLELLDSTKKIILVCRSGARSARAGSQLSENGFENVVSLSGGLLALQPPDTLII